MSDHYDDEDVVDKILVLYASETGNAQDVAERTGREIRRRGGRCTVLSMEDFDISELPHTPLLILITSTHGRGQPPPAMLPIWSALLRSGLPPDILEDVHFALYGLGDSSYEKFCYAGKILGRRMLGLGAQLLGTSDSTDLEDQVRQLHIDGAEEAQVSANGTQNHGCLAWGDERAPEGIEETFVPWLDRTVDSMLAFLPIASSSKTLSATDLPPPLYSLEPVPSTIDDANGLPDRLDRGWHWATLQKNARVTSDDWWQDVREVELELEDGHDIKYAPGSICSLMPEMSDDEVDTFLRYTDLTSRADEVVRIRSLCQDQPIPRHLPHDRPTTLRDLLKRHLDIRSTPRKSFFVWLRRIATEEREIERLDEFIADPDEIHTYATRPKRTILETMADFRSLKLPYSHLLEILPPLRRRQFSIASSSASHPGRVQLLMALVDYKTNLAIRRRGLLSSWLKELPLGRRVPIYVDAPTLFLPNSPEVPVVLVGPGTGVAPMRAFVEERIRAGAAANTALYFGCRSKHKDAFYPEEMAAWAGQGVHIRIAYSRDQEEKVYVQDLIKQDASLLRDWLLKRQGNVYVSGSSNSMPKAVRSALAYCLSGQSPGGSMSEEDAAAYIEDMFESGRRGGEESW